MESFLYKPLLLWFALLTALMAATARPHWSIGSAVSDTGSAISGAAKSAQKAANSINSVNKAATQIGSVVDQAKAAASDPSGTIQQQVKQQLTGPFSDQLAKAIDAGNFCQTDAVKAAFTSGGWDQAYFGKRLWDSKSVAMVVKALIPATSAEAVREIIEELRTQANGLLDMMQKAADDAGADLQAMLEQVFQQFIEGALAGRLAVPQIEHDTFGVKVNIIRVECSSQAAGIKLPAEGYFQIALAYRIRQIKSKTIASVPAVSSVSSDVQSVTCSCRNSNVNPVTGEQIDCSCYYYNQELASDCPGAEKGEGSGMWYKSCD